MMSSLFDISDSSWVVTSDCLFG